MTRPLPTPSPASAVDDLRARVAIASAVAITLARATDRPGLRDAADHLAAALRAIDAVATPSRTVAADVEGAVSAPRARNACVRICARNSATRTTTPRAK
jgi:hypothetical protein